MRITRTYKNLQRLRQIANTFIRHGLGYLVGQFRLQYLLSRGRRLLTFKAPPPFQPPSTVLERVRQVFEELGPSFIKLGQLLSARPDLVPPEFAKEMRKLQDAVPPFAAEEARRCIEEELGLPLDQIFSHFDETPLAAASIAQVHYATLKSGEPVAVKVQRPQLERLIEADIDILFYLAALVGRYLADRQPIKPIEIVEEFAKTIRRELDFTLEAANAERLRRNFQGDQHLFIPKIYWQHTTKRVLTMERVEGIPINQVELIAQQGLDKKLIARNGANAFLKQCLEDGFFHADPHPGNLLVGRNNVIGVMDFGIMGHLDEELMDSLANLFLALLGPDYDWLVREHVKMGLIDGDVDLKGLRRDLRDLIEPYYRRPLYEVQAGKVLDEIFHIAVKYRVRIPVDLLLLGKALITMEGIARELDPELLIFDLARPYAERLVERRFDPARLLGKGYRVMRELVEVGLQLPHQLSQSLDKVVHGALRIEFKVTGLEAVTRSVERIGNKVAIALVLSALVVGSSLVIMASGRIPSLAGLPQRGVVSYVIDAVQRLRLMVELALPLLGVLGYLTAGLLGIGLLVGIWRSRRF